MDLNQMVNRLKQQGEAIIILCEGFTQIQPAGSLIRTAGRCLR